MKFRIKKGDKVVVISGAHRGKTGKVTQLHPAKCAITVEGVNIRKMHKKARPNQPGGIVEKEGPIHYSNVMLLDDKGKKTRIGFKLEEGKKGGAPKKTRIARTTAAAV
jgi:large subunit ribosomal protein L24